MDDKNETSSFDAGRIPRADRIQRLISGTALMLLTVSGLFERFDWRAIIALAIQTELLLTAFAGWCPIYWTCRTKTM